MKNITIETIAKACKGTIYGEILNQEAQGVVIDSRKVEKGFVFIATVGERVDGHNFISQVLEKGALAVVCEKLPEKIEGTCILVDDSFQALKDIATFYRMQLKIQVVGITGSVGKTSTKEFIAAVLAQKYNVHKTMGNFNNEVGVPLTVLQIKEEHQVAILEMGINHFEEMHRLSKIAKPDICVITNIGACHLEYLIDLEGVLRAKSEIFDFMNPKGSVCVNGDDEKLQTLGKIYGNPPIFFGLKDKNDIVATQVKNKGLFGSEVCVQSKKMNSEIFVEIPLPGEHMVYNALAATSVGKLLGLSDEEIQLGVKQVEAVSGRSHIISLHDKVLIDDCYNANPVSMKAAIDLLLTADTRKVAILGDMFELGEREEALHREVGSYLKNQKVDVLICIGKLAKNIEQAAGEKITNKYYFETKEPFLESMENILEAGDTILLKASHGMQFEKIVNALRE